VGRFILVLLAIAGMAHAADPVRRRNCNKRIVRVPIKNLLFVVELETTLLPSPGREPFALFLISHGKASSNPRCGN